MTRDKLLLDVGGTFIKCSDGRQIPIDSAGSRESIVSSLRNAVGDTGRVAVAIPGPFDYENGVFLMKHKFAAVYGERFAEMLPDKEFKFIHDVNCMLLGALQDQDLKKYNRIALVTLGTGLGFTFAVDGIIQSNQMGSPAVPLYNRPYKDGIAEDYASKRGAMRAWSEVTGKPWPAGQSVKDIVKTPSGEAAFALMGGRLGEAAAPLLQELGIECLLLGGQIAKSFHLMGPSLRESLLTVTTLRCIGPLPNLDDATFKGLENLL